MEYLALLRGINVGGNAVIKMTDLKKAVEKAGFTSVRTYIQSGNLIFESNENKPDSITAKLEESLLVNFHLNLRVVVKTHKQLKKIMAEIPPAWKKGDDLRRYIAFIREPLSALEVLPEVELKEGQDFVDAGDGVLYLSTRLSGITKSQFAKLLAKKVSQDITFRNYNTVEKLFSLMH